MKKKLVSIITIALILTMAMSLLSVNAAGKLSDIDFTKWDQASRQEIIFDDKETNSDYGGAPAEWSFEHVLGDKWKVIESGGRKYIDCKGFSQFYLKNAITQSIYVFSVDVKCPANQCVGIFARAAKEKFQYELNTSDFFEQDRTGDFEGMQSLGGSGFYIRPAADKVKLYIKLYDDAMPCDVGNQVYTIDAGADFSANFQKLTYVDNNGVVSIYVNDNLIAAITYSESKKYPIGNEDYYSKLVIKGADGTKLGEHTNGLFAVNPIVAFGNRNNNFMIDNVILTTYNSAANPETGDTLMPVLSSLVVAFVLFAVIYKKRVTA